MKIIGFDTETYLKKQTIMVPKRKIKSVGKRRLPTKREIEEYAIKLYMEENMHTFITPERSELKETGYLKRAQIMLMTDLNKSYLQQYGLAEELEPQQVFVHSFLSAQFYSPPLKLYHFITDPKQVETFFTDKTRSSIFLCNNAEFDLQVLCKILPLKKFKIILCYNKGRFMFGKIKYRNQNKSPTWHFIDLGNIFTHWSLNKIGALINCPKLDKPDYLGKRKPKTPEEWIYFQKYAMRDAEIGFRAGEWLIKKFGKIKVSLPALSFYYFNQKYKPKGLYLNAPSEITQKLRLAYKGGRCESWVRGSPPQKIYVYDVVSLYPYIMATRPFPKGINGLRPKTDINLCHDGVAECIVKQDAPIPFLGLKKMCQDGNVKLVFPNGIFKGWFTYPELRYFCLNKLGKIVKIHQAFESEGCHFFFKDYINEFFKLKQTDMEHADFWKLCMNSLYGKFAQDALSPLLALTEDGEIVKLETKVKRKEFLLTNILVSAYITALAKIKMHKLYSQIGAENLVYTDTDSIHSFKPILNTGNNLGDLSFKMEGYGIYVRSKFYIFNDMVRCRGMEHIFKAEHVKKMIANNDVSILARTLLRLRAAFRRHKPFLTQLETVKRFSLQPDEKRVYLKNLNGAELLNDFSTSVAVWLNGAVA